MAAPFDAPLHVLHIGKTGGTALAEALRPVASESNLVFHGHDWTLRDVPVEEKVAFIVRDPVRRFVSGFNSRLRKGRPRNDFEWDAAEAAAFSRFSTATALGEALGSSDEAVASAAVSAMTGIRHVARKLAFWFESPEYLVARRGDIRFVGTTETLDHDFSAFRHLLRLPPEIELPRDDVSRHATPAGFETRLSVAARRHVEHWYREDMPIYTACLSLRREIMRTIPWREQDPSASNA